MRLQFRQISQLLFDEKTKLLLATEIRFYRDSINQLDQKYPMSHAEKMVISLRRHFIKIEGIEDDNDFLDRFRVFFIINVLKLFPYRFWLCASAM